MQFNRLAIARELGVPRAFNAQAEAARRVDFLCSYLIESRMDCLVLGISDGVDSTAAGRLCQLAVAKACSEGATASFVAMRLPYGQHADKQNAHCSPLNPMKS